jgi:hypothetical protein
MRLLKEAGLVAGLLLLCCAAAILLLELNLVPS